MKLKSVYRYLCALVLILGTTTLQAHEGHAVGAGAHSLEHALWFALPVMLVSLLIIAVCRYLQDRDG